MLSLNEVGADILMRDRSVCGLMCRGCSRVFSDMVCRLSEAGSMLGGYFILSRNIYQSWMGGDKLHPGPAVPPDYISGRPVRESDRPKRLDMTIRDCMQLVLVLAGRCWRLHLSCMLVF